MKTNSIHRKTIDWVSFQEQVNVKAQGAQTIADTYPAIQLALTLLDDHHSFYTSAEGEVLHSNSPATCSDVSPAPVPNLAAIGYIKITNFVGTGSAATNFAQALQDAIKKADSDSIRGWIVDLRGNYGGNMWAMLAGVGPILGEGLAGYFLDPDGNYSTWSYRLGVAQLNQTPEVKVNSPYQLYKPNPKVALLTNRSTASAGEAIAIAFKTRDQTRSFGTPTCGVSTGNIDIPLSDGGRLTLTTVTMVDRTKRIYGQSIEPDESSYSSTAVDNAIAWLLQ
ncbi:S41 family peptidase [Spirosoma radiotolerans]|uniref:S41 family peptidase n=1 Tax=Spirosoma radiotolerans TaxID=1379870 RepID=UPI00130D60B3|nr:S41 family peptidase [Spirosoma radiotolerans]